MAYEVKKSEKVFSGNIIDVYHDTLALPDGNQTVYEIAKHKNAAAVVPVDRDGNIIFVRQYRHPVLDYTIEIPAGLMEDGEVPIDCAMRELEEETGYRDSGLKFLCCSYSSIGFCTEQISLYLATNLCEGKQNFDPEEFITLERYSTQEAIEMIFSGKIIDVKTIAGVLAYNAIINKK